MRKLKMQVLRALARTKNYVVLTDDESIINVEALNPKSLNDAVVVASQRNALVAFRDGLNKLIKDFDKAVAKQLKNKTKAKRSK